MVNKGVGDMDEVIKNNVGVVVDKTTKRQIEKAFENWQLYKIQNYQTAIILLYQFFRLIRELKNIIWYIKPYLIEKNIMCGLTEY